jgi:hypothetical protein
MATPKPMAAKAGTDHPNTAKRKPGAQPGNLNALKHGFYSKHFRNAENADLDILLIEGLADEITMLRVVTRRVLELANGMDDLEAGINLLGALGLASTRLAGLLKVQKMLGGESDNEISKAISIALSEVIEEFK